MTVDLKLIIIILLAVGLLSSGGGMWSLKKENKRKAKEIEIMQYENDEYEKQIKTLHNIAKHSEVSYDSVTLSKFDSTRASFKRHIEQMRLIED